MPSLDTARKVSAIKNNGAKTIGQIHKENSDWAMEYLWDTGVASRVCYIYDYYHDDQPSLKDHMTYEDTTKTRIDAKFIIKSYQSLDKDRVEYYLQFRPSQKIEFEEGDELYYFETDYRQKYGSEPLIGAFVDIPDDKGIYHKWMICEKEIANQFVKFLILPINYRLMWIENNGHERIKRKMWCVLRSQNSYNSGIWRDYNFSSVENQDKCLLPLNPITEGIYYTNDSSTNMRVLVGAPTKHPLAWQISKTENAQPIGIQRLTFYQDFFNKHTDYVNFETGEMYADYYTADSTLVPVDQSGSILSSTANYSKISAPTSAIKVAGTYKTLTAKIYDSLDNEITDNYSSADFEWTCSVGDEDLTDSVTWLSDSNFNQIEIKFPDKTSYLGKILQVICTITSDTEIIKATAQFGLIAL